MLVSIIEAKGTLGKLLMQKDFYTRLENALVKVESTLKNSEAITRDIKSASGKLPNLVEKVNQEMDQVKCILVDLRKASGQLPGLVETTDEAVRTGKEVIDAVKANPLIKMTLPKSPPSESIHLEPRDVPVIFWVLPLFPSPWGKVVGPNLLRHVCWPSCAAPDGLTPSGVR